MFCSSWLDGVPDGEEIYPDVGKTVSRMGYSVSDNNCISKKYPIEIKNCNQYYVYYLKPVRGCLTAYCFGIFCFSIIKVNHGTKDKCYTSWRLN